MSRRPRILRVTRPSGGGYLVQQFPASMAADEPYVGDLLRAGVLKALGLTDGQRVSVVHLSLAGEGAVEKIAATETFTTDPFSKTDGIAERWDLDAAEQRHDVAHERAERLANDLNELAAESQRINAAYAELHPRYVEAMTELDAAHDHLATAREGWDRHIRRQA